MSSAEATEVEDVLTQFLRNLESEVGSHDFERILRGEKTNITRAELGHGPEAWTEDNLIWPLIEAVSLEKEVRPFGSGNKQSLPDFEITNLGKEVLGENKTPNNLDDAISDIEEYLDRKSLGPDYGIATDGIEWQLIKIETMGDSTDYVVLKSANLRPAMAEIASREGLVGSITDYSDDEGTAGDDSIEAFVEAFEESTLNRFITKEAPKRLRDRRKQDVDEFFDLYIELLFGESDSEGFNYETTLFNTIRTPHGATDDEKRLFAIRLTNRLLFIKFLEENNVLSEGFLRSRVSHYSENSEELGGGLYESQIKPIIYGLLDTPKGQRKPRYRDDNKWFSDVPYLNGGLFYPALDRELGYDVDDRILPVLIKDLIEGHELDLDGEIDPALLGSVFEKTINHIEEGKTQEDMGAYYTPTDATQIIVEQSIDPKIRETLIDCFATELEAAEIASSEEVRQYADGLSLEELLLDVEDGKGWFGRPDAEDAIEEAVEALASIDILDPACGSGHFLTTAMDEVFRAQLSLKRGIEGGSSISDKYKYNLKSDLALNSIYGVDVDEIAVEIAKLRTWLKILEENRWDESFGRLPNIDVNIKSGNSLVGYPINAEDPNTNITDFGEDIDLVEDLREEYRDGDFSSIQEAEDLLDSEIRPVLNQEYVDELDGEFTATIEERGALENLLDAVPDSNPAHLKIPQVRVRRESGEGLSDDDKEILEEMGFEWQEWREPNKSATLDVEDFEKTPGEVNQREALRENLLELVDDHFSLTLTRRPLTWDIERSLGTPFHWPVEFPEVAEDDLSVSFDIIVGNPPYGDVLSEPDKNLVSTYKTGGVNEVASQFVERQLDLLAEGGQFGNVVTLAIAYEKAQAPTKELVSNKLNDARMACFANRPSQLFADAQPRPAIVSGKRVEGDNGTMETTRFVRFTAETREEVMSDLSYEDTEGLHLGERIGSGEQYSIPKVGDATTRSILEKLKNQSRFLGDEYKKSSEKESGDGYDNLMWRRRGAGYWIHPMLEDLYPQGDTPTSMYEMYFDSDLKRKIAFISLQSSLYYVYWMAYKNGRNMDWMETQAFPMPDDETLEEHASEIEEVADRLWEAMENRFVGNIRQVFERAVELKPIVDDVDDLIGPMFGLSEEEVQYVKDYDTEHERGLDTGGSITLEEAVSSQ
ncbi:Eco57I restriction-modification methylase domain-containing protein [Natrinema limicola]|uniref:site-specific DNA-methyltransferase (adenine-specific) n=1 Tax=Natrinema limicola JCM 13563 TaxID=1230457 RepID=M0C2N2_9EURY|nr:DNA methyltransferase [Natrinema limicola]ELZ16582.1 hypothetical protein C476_16992 [Natrinema limicola JCM 13563]